MGLLEQLAMQNQQSALNAYYYQYIRSQYGGFGFDGSSGLQNIPLMPEPKKEIPDEVLLLLEV